MQALTFFFAFVAVLALIGACGLAGAAIRRQQARRQHQSGPDAAAGRDRCRRRRWSPPAGAGAARQYRASADDRRSDRHRRGTQYRARACPDAISCRTRPGRLRRSRRPGWRRCPTPAGPTATRTARRLRSRRAADARAAAASGAAFFCRRSAPPGARRRDAGTPERRSDPLAGSRRSRSAAVRNRAPNCAANRCPRA